MHQGQLFPLFSGNKGEGTGNLLSAHVCSQHSPEKQTNKQQTNKKKTTVQVEFSNEEISLLISSRHVTYRVRYWLTIDHFSVVFFYIWNHFDVERPLISLLAFAVINGHVYIYQSIWDLLMNHGYSSRETPFLFHTVPHWWLIVNCVEPWLGSSIPFPPSLSLFLVSKISNHLFGN